MTMRILVALDGSAHALRAVEHVLRLRAAVGELEVHLLNVQIPIESGHVRLFVSHDQLEDYYREEGLGALQEARTALEAAGQSCVSHIAVGHIAETIARYASEMGIDQIVMGSHGRSGLTHLLLGSVAADVIRQSSIPVTIVNQ